MADVIAMREESMHQLTGHVAYVQAHFTNETVAGVLVRISRSSVRIAMPCYIWTRVARPRLRCCEHVCDGAKGRADRQMPGGLVCTG